MNHKRKSSIAILGVLSLLAMAIGSRSVFGRLGSNSDEAEGPARSSERSYTLPNTQGEVLALLLRLSMPRETTVTTKPRDESVDVVISGPKQVHDGVGPLVGLLQAEQLAKDERRMKEIKQRGQERFQRHLKEAEERVKESRRRGSRTE